MLKEIQYRTFDELLDSVRIDLKTYNLEGLIDNQALIKVAMRVSYELGLKVNPSRSKMIELSHGKAKLPSDFDVLNFALVCFDKRMDMDMQSVRHDYRTYCQGVIDGKQYEEDLIRSIANTKHVQYIDIVKGENLITHNLKTKDFIVQAFQDDELLLDFELRIPNSNQFYIISLSEEVLENIKVVVLTDVDVSLYENNAQILNPCEEGIISTCCNKTSSYPTVGTCVEIEATDCGCNVSCSTNHSKYKYHKTFPIRMEKNKSVSPDCFNLISSYRYQAKLKNGFFVSNIETGEIYINYQSLMEDDEGNLLVMDHPLVNEFYEYAIKQRIFEDMYLNGEQVKHAMDLIESRLRSARNNALSFVNTPDFSEMKKLIDLNRKAQMYNYYTPFKDNRNLNYNRY